MIEYLQIKFLRIVSVNIYCDDFKKFVLDDDWKNPESIAVKESVNVGKIWVFPQTNNNKNQNNTT